MIDRFPHGNYDDLDTDDPEPLTFTLYQDARANWTASCSYQGNTYEASGAFPTSAMGSLMCTLSQADIVDVRVSTENGSTYVQRQWTAPQREKDTPLTTHRYPMDEHREKSDAQ